MADPLEIVVVLDVDAQVHESEFAHLLSAERREQRLLRLSKLGGPPPGGDARAHLDWETLSRALLRVDAEIRGLTDGAAERDVELYVCGRAPLPVYAALGSLVSKFHRATEYVLNPRRGGSWEKYPLRGGPPGPAFFAPSPDAARSPMVTTAAVAVFISTIGAPVVPEPIRDFLEENDEQFGALEEIRTSRPGELTPESAPAMADELAGRLSQIAGVYPNARCFAVFVAGPAVMAYAVGRALNPNVFKIVLLANFTPPKYVRAFRLPLRLSGPPPIPDGAEDRLARRYVHEHIVAGITDLTRTIETSDFPSWHDDSSKLGWIDYLKDLTIESDASGDEFGLSILARRLKLGRGLLDALRGWSNSDDLGTFGQMLLLHELVHDEQGLRSSNYHEIGRAGVVLEEVDFAADCFALVTLLKRSLRRGGVDALESAGKKTAAVVGILLEGLVAFDRFSQGDRIEHLPERRLRRYLIWNLMAVRVEAIGRASEPRDVESFFRDRLVVELAPLRGRLDGRFDKIVEGSIDSTELIASLGGRLLRPGRHPQVDPAALIQDVRTYQRARLRASMEFLVEQYRSLMIPTRS